jgi:hypothetical protein
MNMNNLREDERPRALLWPDIARLIDASTSATEFISAADFF